MREQLSGACTTEIAAFDEFAALLASEGADAPHLRPCGVRHPRPPATLRLLSLPKAWTGFLAGNDRGASCLGPHSGLKMQEARFNAALAALSNPALTTVVLVTRPDPRPMQEAARTAVELRALGLANQRLAINGVFRASQPGQDRWPTPSSAWAARPWARCLMPWRNCRATKCPACLRHRGPASPARLAGWGCRTPATPAAAAGAALQAEPLAALADALAAKGHGLIMVMGKGGVGKTTIAAALAVGLVQQGHSVHLTTTDPAAHVQNQLDGSLPGLKVGRIDPQAETQAYIDKIAGHARQGPWTTQAARCCWKICSRPAPKRWPCSMPSAAW